VGDPAGNHLQDRFSPPAGFERVDVASGSFAHFLRRAPLKPAGTPVRLFDGTLKRRQDVHAAVLDYDAGTRDLQQCADAVMRLRAEWLWSTGRASEIRFRFTNGFAAEFWRWMRGERIIVSGSTARWVRSAPRDSSHRNLRQFLDVVYSYAGTRSLEKELVPVRDRVVQPGDVFIWGGSPGHAVLVMDVAVNAAGDRVALLAQSYMPAQDIHVLRNPDDAVLSPWFRVDGLGNGLRTPEWDFGADALRRWE